MLLNFEDYVNHCALNESLITEEVDIRKMIQSVKNIKDKNKYIKELIDKFNSTTNKFIKRNISILLILLYFGNAVVNHSTVSHLFKSKINKAAIELSNKEEIKVSDLKTFSIFFSDGYSNIEEVEEEENKIKSVDIRTVKTSEDGIELIKDHEKLVLNAYALGDGMITIGYGHANPIATSMYKVGDAISKSEAYRLFNNDLKRKEEGVRRMLLKWEKEGIDVKITQSMFDAMVSMAFNMGLGGLMRSEFVQYIKKGDYEHAAELIKTTRINPRFPGLEIRRQSESELFLKDFDMT